ncbi:MAG: alanine--tRNA ligase, partial [Planctomycetota bacterium]|nr:alanine--tRNA ligase [Planctomycetota bacterium]
YESDLFQPLMDRIVDLTKKPYEAGPGGTPHRVIADHARAITVAIADGAIPSNEGRGYVVRRILRRASRFARNLGVHEPTLWHLVSRVVEDLGPVFPTVRDSAEQVEMIVRGEEERFGLTLDKGIKIFEKMVRGLKGKKDGVISGLDAFTLYDTYGFPLDLTELMAREKDLKVDARGFEEEMKKQTNRSREAAESDGVKRLDLSSIQFLKGKTGTPFTGYAGIEGRSKVLGAGEIEHEGQEAVALILEQTPFYAESGGQVGDTGRIVGDDFAFDVLDTRKVDDRIVHIGRFVTGTIKSPGAPAEAAVDGARRRRITRNHSGTHVMHWALRETLGSHVRQQGSLVAPDRLRFDFAHPRKVSSDEVFEIERLVNEKIRRSFGLDTSEIAYQEAIKQGILAFFGDKYGDLVRVVDIGGFSRELCGGTHVHHTGEIGFFLISSESSIASGVRRVEAVTGREAIEQVISHRGVIAEMGKLLRAAPDQFARRIQSLQDEIKDLRKRPAATTIDAKTISRKLLGDATVIGGAKLITADLPDIPLADLRRVADSLRSAPEPVAGVLATAAEGKVHLLAFVADTLVKGKNLKAGTLIKEIAPIVGGGGGGRPEFAQAGGRDASKIPDALERAAEIMTTALSQ